MPRPSIVSRLIKPTDHDKLNPQSYHVVIPLTHVDDASLLIAHNFDIVSLLVPHTWYLKRLLAALDAVSVNAILIRLGVPVVFQVCVIANVEDQLVHVSEFVSPILELLVVVALYAAQNTVELEAVIFHDDTTSHPLLVIHPAIN